MLNKISSNSPNSIVTVSTESFLGDLLKGLFSKNKDKDKKTKAKIDLSLKGLRSTILNPSWVEPIKDKEITLTTDNFTPLVILNDEPKLSISNYLSMLAELDKIVKKIDDISIKYVDEFDKLLIKTYGSQNKIPENPDEDTEEFKVIEEKFERMVDSIEKENAPLFKQLLTLSNKKINKYISYKFDLTTNVEVRLKKVPTERTVTFGELSNLLIELDKNKLIECMEYIYYIGDRCGYMLNWRDDRPIFEIEDYRVRSDDFITSDLILYHSYVTDCGFDIYRLGDDSLAKIYSEFEKAKNG